MEPEGNLRRRTWVAHPFLDLRALAYPNVPTMLVLFGAMCLLVATGNVLQSAYTGGVLHTVTWRTFRSTDRCWWGPCAVWVFPTWRSRGSGSATGP